jgi:hypothetical protein
VTVALLVYFTLLSFWVGGNIFPEPAYYPLLPAKIIEVKINI